MRKILNCGLVLVLSVLFLGAAGSTVTLYADSLVVGDFNNDSYPDVAVRDITRGICVLLSNGDRSFQPARCYPAGPGPVSILTGDLNNDDNLDLLALNPERGPLASGIAVLLGNGDGTFQPISRVLFPAGPYPRLFALGDLDGDGNLDVAVLGALGSLCSLKGEGDGHLASPQCFTIRYAEAAHTLQLGNLRGERRASFVYVTPDRICSWSGTTREPRCTPTRIRSRAATLADFTGDNVLDVALTGEMTPTAPNAVCVYAGNESGGFDLAACTPYRTTVNTNLMAVADLNRDTILDLVLGGSSRARSEAVALLGEGDGRFRPMPPIGLPIQPALEGLAVDDFVGDGIPDLVLFGSDKLCIMAGNGLGEFGDPVCFSIQPTRDTVQCVADPPIFPTFDKSCETDDDCAFGLHQVNCCGGAQAIGFNVEERDRFRKAEAICGSQYPACGCYDCRITTEDGRIFCRDAEWQVTVRCQARQCMTAAQAP